LLEIPLTIQDVGILKSSNQHDISQSLADAKALISQIAKDGGVVTLSWHAHPQSPYAYDFYDNLLHFISDLGGWGCSVSDINSHWRTRRNELFPSDPRPNE
jgi:hypothetical protein